MINVENISSESITEVPLTPPQIVSTLQIENLLKGAALLQNSQPAPVSYDDNSMWCDQCKNSVRRQCKKHGKFTRIRDRKIPSRARLTVPHMLSARVLAYRTEGRHENGVFAKKVVQKNSQFGPYEAPEATSDSLDKQKGLTIRLIKPDGSTKLLDSSNENLCNWMTLVRPARDGEEYNVVALQFRKHVYFITTKALAVGDELRVWYAEPYRKAIGVDSLVDSGQQENTSSKPAEPVKPDIQEALTTEDSTAADATDAEDFYDEDDYEVKDEAADEESEPQPAAAASPVKESPKPEVSEVVMSSDIQNFDVHEEKPAEQIKENDLDLHDSIKPDPAQVLVVKEALETQTVTYMMNIDEAEAEGRRTKSKRKGRPVKVMTENDKNETLQEVKSKVGLSVPEGVSEAGLRKSKKARKLRGKGTKASRAAVRARGMAARQKKQRPPGQLITCEACDKAYATERELSIHKKIEHAGERIYRCTEPDCDKSFNTKFKLQRHLLIHKDDKPYKCAYCTKGFHRRDHLKTHIQIHDPKKMKHYCDKCNREYTSSYGFKMHRAFHAIDEGSLTCLVCNKDFELKETLVQHLKVHMGSRTVKDESDKKCMCPYCGKKFFVDKDVKRHMIVHTRDRDYLCQYCPQRFGRKDHLVRHIRRSHPNEAQPDKIQFSRIMPPEYVSPPRPKVKDKTEPHVAAINNIPISILADASASTVAMATTEQEALETVVTEQQNTMATSKELTAQHLIYGVGSVRPIEICPVPGIQETNMSQTYIVPANMAGKVDTQAVVQTEIPGSDYTGQVLQSNPVFTKLTSVPAYDPQTLVPYTIASTLVTPSGGVNFVIGGTAAQVTQVSPAPQYVTTQPATTQPGLVTQQPGHTIADHQYSAQVTGAIPQSPVVEKANTALNALTSQMAQERISYTDALRVLGNLSMGQGQLPASSVSSTVSLLVNPSLDPPAYSQDFGHG